MAKSKVGKRLAKMHEFPEAMSYWYGSAGAVRERASGEATRFHKKKQQRSKTMKALKSLAKGK